MLAVDDESSLRGGAPCDVPTSSPFVLVVVVAAVNRLDFAGDVCMDRKSNNGC